MNSVGAALSAAFSIGFVILSIAWVTFFPAVGALYIFGWFN